MLMLSTGSTIDIFQFRNDLLKMGKDRRNLVQNSSECRQKAEEGKVIVLKGDPLPAALLWTIIVTVAVTISIIFSFDTRTVIILLASILIGFIAYFSDRNKMLILHPEGFLFRKMIFLRFCQKWKNLTRQPEFDPYTTAEGFKGYSLIFTGIWGIKKVDIKSLKIKDIKNKKLKSQLLWEITLKYYPSTKLS